MDSDLDREEKLRLARKKFSKFRQQKNVGVPSSIPPSSTGAEESSSNDSNFVELHVPAESFEDLSAPAPTLNLSETSPAVIPVISHAGNRSGDFFQDVSIEPVRTPTPPPLSNNAASHNQPPPPSAPPLSSGGNPFARAPTNGRGGMKRVFDNTVTASAPVGHSTFNNSSMASPVTVPLPSVSNVLEYDAADPLHAGSDEHVDVPLNDDQDSGSYRNHHHDHHEDDHHDDHGDHHHHDHHHDHNHAHEQGVRANNRSAMEGPGSWVGGWMGRIMQNIAPPIVGSSRPETPHSQKSVEESNHTPGYSAAGSDTHYSQESSHQNNVNSPDPSPIPTDTSKDKRIAELEQALAQSQAARKSVESKVQTLTAQINGALEKIVLERDEARAERDSARREVHAAHDKIKELEQRVAEPVTQSVKIDAEQQHQLEQWEFTLRNLKEQVDRDREAVEQSKRALASEFSELDRQRQEHEEREFALQEREEQLSHQQHHQTQQQQPYEEDTTAVETVEREAVLRKREQSLQDERNTLHSLRTQYETQRNEMAQREQDLLRRLDALQAKIKSWEQREAELTKREEEVLNGEMRVEWMREESVKAQTQSATANDSATQKRLEELTSENESLAKEITLLRDRQAKMQPQSQPSMLDQSDRLSVTSLLSTQEKTTEQLVDVIRRLTETNQTLTSRLEQQQQGSPFDYVRSRQGSTVSRAGVGYPAPAPLYGSAGHLATAGHGNDSLYGERGITSVSQAPSRRLSISSQHSETPSHYSHYSMYSRHAPAYGGSGAGASYGNVGIGVHDAAARTAAVRAKLEAVKGRLWRGAVGVTNNTGRDGSSMLERPSSRNSGFERTLSPTVHMPHQLERTLSPSVHAQQQYNPPAVSDVTVSRDAHRPVMSYASAPPNNPSSIPPIPIASPQSIPHSPPQASSATTFTHSPTNDVSSLFTNAHSGFFG
ncbi:hypothetical protein HDU85_000559 [Gaertneriomyces sp. JEL0708]|nr:hypothetical protein HDU85_000559 [Gaertneriomyces sp. JEL0708]